MRDLLTVKETAEELAYHPNHVRRLLQSGTMKGEKIGNYWFVPRTEIQRIKAGQDEHGRFHGS